MTEPSAEPDAPADDSARELRAVLDRAADGISRPDAPAESSAREHVGSGTAEASRLGRLAEWVIWLSGVQGSYPPRALDRVQLLLIGAPPPAEQSGHRLVDLTGVMVSSVVLQPDWSNAAAAEAGLAAVDAAVDAGCDLLVTSAPVPAALSSTLVALLLRLTATEVVGDSDYLDDAGWAELVGDIRDRSRSIRGLEDDPIALLDALGSPELVALVAIVLRAAARRTPVLLDGAADTVAALCASRHAILASWWWLAAATSSDPAATRAMDALGLEPVTNLACRLDGGATALAALPLLRAAQRMVDPS